MTKKKNGPAQLIDCPPALPYKPPSEPRALATPSKKPWPGAVVSLSPLRRWMMKTPSWLAYGLPGRRTPFRNPQKRAREPPRRCRSAFGWPVRERRLWRPTKLQKDLRRHQLLYFGFLTPLLTAYQGMEQSYTYDSSSKTRGHDDFELAS